MPTPPPPPKLFYNLKVKLVNLGENFKAPSPGSPDFDNLSNEVGTSFEKVLAKVPGFNKIEVDEFTG